VAFQKRLFDFIVTLLTAPAWIPAMLVTSLAILIMCGRPVFYFSNRYITKNTFGTVFKFRTMVRNAEQIANRDTVEYETDKVLNIVINKSLYTPLGLFLERIHFTELPQLAQVLTGKLTLVGNRPMPENMLKIGRELYPYIEERFSIPCGITGPAQLAGRDRLSDEERLELEITYSYFSIDSYNPLLDFYLLLITLFTPFGFFRDLSHQDMMNIIYRFVSKNKEQNLRQKVDAITGKLPATTS
jgi:lipopolysaccharide/colanic/teichoic acid biosynthesis glycosyltransferase